jgi:hypothetical protein
MQVIKRINAMLSSEKLAATKEQLNNSYALNIELVT